MRSRHYRDPRSGFEIALPSGWRQPGLLSRVLRKGDPEFYGPKGTSIKFAVGPIDPFITVEQQKRNLTGIAARYGHEVLSVGEIENGFKKHATMTCVVPQVGTLKNYSLIFSGVEYFVTARGDFDVVDAIVATFMAP